MLSGPERTRWTEPCWGKASVYSRATRLPAGRRREKRASSGRTLFPRSAPRGSGDSAEFTRSALRAAGFLLWTIPGRVHRRRVPGSTSFRPVCFASKRESAFSSLRVSNPTSRANAHLVAMIPASSSQSNPPKIRSMAGANPLWLIMKVLLKVLLPSLPRVPPVWRPWILSLPHDWGQPRRRGARVRLPLPTFFEET